MDGYSVNTGYFTANAQVRGVFNSTTENFDPQKHSILFRFNQGDLLRKEIPNVTVEVMGVGDSSILISHVVDAKTGSVNDLLTPGGALKIKGGKLKIAGVPPRVGVWFTNESGHTIRVPDRDMIINNPSELIVQIPDLPAGTYRLEITTQYGGNSKAVLKEPRTSIFDKPLTVA